MLMILNSNVQEGIIPDNDDDGDNCKEQMIRREEAAAGEEKWRLV